VIPQRRLLVATALVVLMIALVVLFGRQQRPDSVLPGTGERWLAGLEPQLGEVRRVRLQSGAAVSTLVRAGERWGVEERAAYAVDVSRLGTLLRDLAQARPLEQKTAKPEYFDRLGLADVEKPDSKAVLLELWTAGEAPVHRVLIGNAAEGRTGRYVRGADSNQTWLVDRSLQAFAEPTDWLDRGLLEFDFAGVAAVTRALPGKTGFRAARATREQASLAVEDIPAGRKPRYESVFDSAARAVLGAEAEDVKRSAAEDFGVDMLARTDIEFFDGLRLEVDAVKGADGNWIRVRALAGTPVPVPGPASAEAAKPADSATSSAESPEDSPVAATGGEAKDDAAATGEGVKPLAERVAALNQRLDGWAYKVSDYVYGELSKPLEDYLDEDKPATEKAADAG
jgi:hypothetical protein